MRRIALAAAVLGGLGSVTFLLRAGSRNSSLILLAIGFSLWVVSPFVLLVWAIIKSARWQMTAQSMLHWSTIAIAVMTMVIYSKVINIQPAGAPNAFLFVAVPPASWLAIATTMIIAKLGSGKSR